MSEHSSFFHHITVKARKIHKCCECRGAIQLGEKYHKFSGVWNGDFDTFKRCLDCHALAIEIESQNENDFGRSEENNVWFYGLTDHVAESDGEERLSKLVAIMQKRGATVPQWAIDRLKGDEE